MELHLSCYGLHNDIVLLNQSYFATFSIGYSFSNKFVDTTFPHNKQELFDKQNVRYKIIISDSIPGALPQILFILQVYCTYYM